MKYLKVLFYITLVFSVFAVIAYNGFYLVLENLIFPNSEDAEKYFASPAHILTAPWVFFGLPIFASSFLAGLYIGGTAIWFRIFCVLCCCFGLWVYFASTYGEVGVLSALDLKAIVYINSFTLPALLLWAFFQSRAAKNA